MRIDYLRYLIEIDKHHSISKAARDLYMGQTTLSTIVKGLEKDLGFDIFQRTPTGVVTTAEGEELLSLAWEISAKFEEVRGLGRQSKMVAEPVALLASPSINCSLALPLSKAFLESEPYGTLVFNESTGSEVGPRIIQNEASLGLTYYTADVREEFRATAAKYKIQVKKVFHDHLYLLMRRDHPLAGRREVSAQVLADEHLAMLPHFLTNSGTSLLTTSLQQAGRFTTFSNTNLVKQAVAEQNMVSVLSGYAIGYDRAFPPDQYRAALLTGLHGENEMSLCLIHRSNGNLRYLEKVALKCIESHFAQLLPPPFSPEAVGELI